VSAADPVLAPVTDDELDDLFALFPSGGPIILAVSGGADSTALMLLAHRWRTRRAHGPDLVVATVDHGLRAGSRREAERVCALARTFGLPHELLAWTGAKPSTGIEAAARDARYALLTECAGRCQATHLALAHTLDDQAETVLMRLAAGSAPAGLAGMRSRETRHGLTLLRPLLGLRKGRLIATLQRAGMAWTEDPSNVDHAFARARLRGAHAALAREGLTPERLARLARRMARYEDVVAEGAQAARVFAGHADRPGRLSGAALAALPEELALRVLGAEIREVVGGPDRSSQPARLHRLEALWTDLRPALLAGRPAKRTLGGALITVEADRSVLVTRAPPRPPQAPPVGQSVAKRPQNRSSRPAGVR
jgi:tRNA(Ile)-lysidine synthase